MTTLNLTPDQITRLASPPASTGEAVFPDFDPTKHLAIREHGGWTINGEMHIPLSDLRLSLDREHRLSREAAALREALREAIPFIGYESFAAEEIKDRARRALAPEQTQGPTT